MSTESEDDSPLPSIGQKRRRSHHFLQISKFIKNKSIKTKPSFCHPFTSSSSSSSFQGKGKGKCGSSSIKLVEIPFNCSDHGLFPEAENTNSLPYNLVGATPTLKLPFKKLLADLTEIQGGEKPLCIIADFFGWASDVAHEFGIFHALVSGTSGFGMACYYSLWLNLPHKHNKNVEFFLPGFPEAGKLRHSTGVCYVGGRRARPYDEFPVEISSDMV
ncbi:hypothetical protein Pfo_006583 [Paulownia fortunei]|nr:hypothetical protein Pfo_006583 [Paulownia fortunei]